MKPRNTTRFLQATHNDQQGQLETALSGVTAFTRAQYRNTGIVLNDVASGDVFSMAFQFSHERKYQSNLDSVHIHFIPKASANGNIAFTYAWGWYNNGDVIPDTLPNTGTVADIALLTTDQYKLTRTAIVTNIAPPASENYSSILFIRVTATAPAGGVNWWTSGGTNAISLAYMDAHTLIDRTGSINEGTD